MSNLLPEPFSAYYVLCLYAEYVIGSLRTSSGTVKKPLPKSLLYNGPALKSGFWTKLEI